MAVGANLVKAGRDALRQLQGDGGAVRGGVGADGGDLRRQVQRKVAQVDVDRPFEAKHAQIALLAELGNRRHGPVELYPEEGGVAADADIGARVELLDAGGLALALGADRGILGAAGQLVDDVLRERRRHALPALRQKVDKQLLAGLDAIEVEGALEAETQPHAVGVHPRDGEIVRHGDAHIGQDHGDRFAELERQDAVLDAHRVFGQVIPPRKAEDQPAIAIILGGKELSLSLGKGGPRTGQQRERKGEGQYGPPPPTAERVLHRLSARPTLTRV